MSCCTGCLPQGEMEGGRKGKEISAGTGYQRANVLWQRVKSLKTLSYERLKTGKDIPVLCLGAQYPL